MSQDALRLADALDPLKRTNLDNLTCAVAAVELRRLHAEVARLKAEREWQPIETAPKDGKVCMLLCTAAVVGSTAEAYLARWAQPLGLHGRHKRWNHLHACADPLAATPSTPTGEAMTERERFDAWVMDAAKALGIRELPCSPESRAYVRVMFLAWAKDNLGQGYSTETDESTFIDPVTRWCEVGFEAGLRASQAERQAATVPPELPEESALLKLARRTLWIAYVWNDHNFDAAHTYARTVAKECGITNFEDARAWLEAAASIGRAET